MNQAAGNVWNSSQKVSNRQARHTERIRQMSSRPPKMRFKRRLVRKSSANKGEKARFGRREKKKAQNPYPVRARKSRSD